ncbi:unnamed protein product [Heterobilharzia americana]|nr:unnamed protein product [Heterobilharzia americana]
MQNVMSRSMINGDSPYYSATITRSPVYGLGLGISDVINGGPAFNRVGKDDELIGVNGVSLEGLKYSEAIQILRDCGEEVELQLKRCEKDASYHAPIPDFTEGSTTQHKSFSSSGRYFQPEFFESVCSNHGTNALKYCSDTALWNKSYQSKESIKEDHPRLVEIHLKGRNAGESLGVELLSRLIVASVDKGSMGAQAGLKCGDRIVTLNGINAAHLSLIDTANMLRRQETVLLVAREPCFKQNVPNNYMNTPPLINSSSVPADLSGLVAHQLTDYNKQYPLPQPIMHPENTFEYQVGERQFEQAYQRENHVYQNLGKHHRSYEGFDNKTCICDNTYVKSPTVLTHSQDNIPITCGNQCKYNMHHNNVSLYKSNPNLICLKKSGSQLPDLNEHNCLNSIGNNKKQPLGSMNSPKTRKVTLQLNNSKGEVGLVLIGGNTTGIYVNKVIPDSVADQAGVGEGDKLIKLNGNDLKGWTKEEVFLSLMANENKMILELLHDPLSYRKLLESENPYESFYIRAYFNMNQYVSGSSALISSTKYSGLNILKGDIFHVHNTLVDDALGSWLAKKVYPNISDIGLIPNEQRAQRYISVNQVQDNQKTSFTLPSYERVIQLERFPFPRPVVIFGPLCELARQRLAQMSSISSTKTDYFIEETMKFIIPPINSAFSNLSNHLSTSGQNINNNKLYGLVRLSAINECMKRGYHCLLDIGSAAIERLGILGIPPIVILINPSSKSQLKELLKHYWQFNKNSAALLIPSKAGNRTRATIREMVTFLWNSVVHLRQHKSYFITDTVPLLTINSKKNSFSEVEWLRNLTEVIRHHQNSPVWIGEETEIGQLQLSETAEEDETVTKDDPDTPRPSFCNTSHNNVDNQTETRRSFRSQRETSEKMDENVENQNFSTLRQNGIYPVSSDHGKVYHSDEEKYNNEPIPFKSNDKLNSKGFFGHKCDCGNMNQISREEDNFRQINEHTDVSAALNFPPLSLETLRLHIESTSIKYPQVNQSLCEKKNVLSNTHPINDSEPIDGQTPTISPTLSLHHLVFDEITSSDCRRNDDQKAQSLDLMSNTADPHSAISSLPTSPRIILAEKCGEFGPEGGILEITEHKVCLRIPAGAISEEEGMQKIFLRVYDSGNELPLDDLPSESRLPSDKPILVSPMVMCGPRGLKFHKPVELTVPRYPLDSESSDESEINCGKHLEKWNLSLLHASAISTSTSTDNDSLPRTSRSNEPTKWHEIPLSANNELSLRKGKYQSQGQKNGNNQGILSMIKDSKISILIDHF